MSRDVQGEQLEQVLEVGLGLVRAKLELELEQDLEQVWHLQENQEHLVHLLKLAQQLKLTCLLHLLLHSLLHHLLLHHLLLHHLLLHCLLLLLQPPVQPLHPKLSCLHQQVQEELQESPSLGDPED
jgi:hypothetical protein